jgi:hypothetical protein
MLYLYYTKLCICNANCISEYVRWTCPSHYEPYLHFFPFLLCLVKCYRIVHYRKGIIFPFMIIVLPKCTVSYCIVKYAYNYDLRCGFRTCTIYIYTHRKGTATHHVVIYVYGCMLCYFKTPRYISCVKKLILLH